MSVYKTTDLPQYPEAHDKLAIHILKGATFYFKSFFDNKSWNCVDYQLVNSRITSPMETLRENLKKKYKKQMTKTFKILKTWTNKDNKEAWLAKINESKSRFYKCKTENDDSDDNYEKYEETFKNVSSLMVDEKQVNLLPEQENLTKTMKKNDNPFKEIELSELPKNSPESGTKIITPTTPNKSQENGTKIIPTTPDKSPYRQKNAKTLEKLEQIKQNNMDLLEELKQKRIARSNKRTTRKNKDSNIKYEESLNNEKKSSKSESLISQDISTNKLVNEIEKNADELILLGNEMSDDHEKNEVSILHEHIKDTINMDENTFENLETYHSKIEDVLSVIKKVNKV